MVIAHEQRSAKSFAASAMAQTCLRLFVKSLPDEQLAPLDDNGKTLVKPLVDTDRRVFVFHVSGMHLAVFQEVDASVVSPMA